MYFLYLITMECEALTLWGFYSDNGLNGPWTLAKSVQNDRFISFPLKCLVIQHPLSSPLCLCMSFLSLCSPPCPFFHFFLSFFPLLPPIASSFCVRQGHRQRSPDDTTGKSHIHASASSVDRVTSSETMLNRAAHPVRC